MNKAATAEKIIESNEGAGPQPAGAGRGPRGPRVDWAQADDRALAQAMAEMNNDAWLEFERRWMPTMLKRLRFVIGTCGKRVRSNDTLEDIKSEVFIALMRNGQSRLRAFDPKRGSLGSWICLIAQQVAVQQLGKVSKRPIPEPMDTLTERADARNGAQRGAKRVGQGI